MSDKSVADFISELRIAVIPTFQGMGWRARAFAEYDLTDPNYERPVSDWPKGDTLDAAVHAAVEEYEGRATNYDDFFDGIQPDIVGAGGAAWKVRIDPDDYDHTHIKSAWLINSLVYDETASWYIVASEELSDKTYKAYPLAQYNALISIVRKARTPLIKGVPPSLDLKDAEIVSPVIAMTQFDKLSQRGIEAMTEGAVREILDVKLAPKEEYSTAWQKWFWTKVAKERVVDRDNLMQSKKE